MQAIEETLRKFGIESVEIIQQNIAEAGQNASGQTSREIKWETPKPNRLVVDGPPYVYVLETGRRPGRMPPIKPILDWIATGKPNITNKIESAAWAISKTIAAKGTKLFQQGGRRDIITPALSEDRFDQLTNDIADISFKLVVNKIDEGLNGAPNP